MEKFSSDYFRQLAEDLMFHLSEKEIEQLKTDFQAVEAQVEAFDSIDTEGVEPMVYPFEEPTVFIREDEIIEPLSQKEALANASETSMGHFHVPTVIKEDN